MLLVQQKNKQKVSVLYLCLAGPTYKQCYAADTTVNLQIILELTWSAKYRVNADNIFCHFTKFIRTYNLANVYM